jgi:hypothetical protein
MEEKNLLENGVILILSDRNATVFVDGLLLGSVENGTHQKFEVFPGEHFIKITSEDEQYGWESKIIVPSGQQVIVEPKFYPIDLAIGIPNSYKLAYENKIYKTVIIRALGQEWFAENLTVQLPGSVAPALNNANIPKYGRLYQFDSYSYILADGFRIPTKKDFLKLVELYNNDPIQLLPEGKSNFNMQLASLIPIDNYPSPVGSDAAYWLNEPIGSMPDVRGRHHPSQQYFGYFKGKIGYHSFFTIQKNSIRLVRDLR